MDVPSLVIGAVVGSVVAGIVGGWFARREKRRDQMRDLELLAVGDTRECLLSVIDRLLAWGRGDPDALMPAASDAANRYPHLRPALMYGPELGDVETWAGRLLEEGFGRASERSLQRGAAMAQRIRHVMRDQEEAIRSGRRAVYGNAHEQQRTEALMRLDPPRPQAQVF